MAWAPAQKPWSLSLPGTTKLHHPTEKNETATIELTTDELRAIEETSAQIGIVGALYGINGQVDRTLISSPDQETVSKQVTSYS